MQTYQSINKVLVANRGEIACRVMRTCRDMGIATVAVYSEADATSAFVRQADEAVCIGPPPSRESYLVIDAILDAARRTGADAIHPGYGFLSENADFAQACAEAGVVFVGPSPDAIRAMGSKAASKALMATHDVPVIPGYEGEDQALETLLTEAERVGFPLLLKASAGGGGKGMRVVESLDELEAALTAARREALAAFGDERMIIERYVTQARHVEVQILGDRHGQVIHCYERECSLQRRHQKIVEETPSVALDAEQREAMGEAAVRAGQAIGYEGAGTVEFLLEPDGSFYFLEMNTRLQVEHPVTEMVTGLDLVRLQLHVAEGRPLPIAQSDVGQCGHAVECRIYSEDPAGGFLPSTGTLEDWWTPEAKWLRVDTGVGSGDEVSIHYDPMLAKVVTWGETREEATRRMVHTLERASFLGVTTNRAFLVDLLRQPAWGTGEVDTGFVERTYAGENAWTPRVDPAARWRAAAVATVAEAEARREARVLLPHLPVGFRNNAWRDSHDAWQVGEGEENVYYRADAHTGWWVRPSADEEPLRVDVIGRQGPALRVAIDGHLMGYRVVRRADTTWVHGDGGSFCLSAVPRFPDAHEEGGGGDCRAPMPGKVLEVRVSAGDSVTEGQPLVVLEAMKMEHSIRAPRDGVVETVLVAPGEQVDADAALLALVDEGSEQDG